MCNLYIFDRVLGMSSFMHKLVSIDIHVMCAVTHSIVRVNLSDINVHMAVSVQIAVMCAVRRSLKRVTL